MKIENKGKKILWLIGFIGLGGILYRIGDIATNEDRNFYSLLGKIIDLKLVLGRDDLYALKISSEPLKMKWVYPKDSSQGGMPWQDPLEPSHNITDPIIEMFRGPTADTDCMNAHFNLVKAHRTGYCVEIKNGSDYKL